MFYCITGVKKTFCYIEDFVISRLHGGQKQVLVVQKQIIIDVKDAENVEINQWLGLMGSYIFFLFEGLLTWG